MSVAIQRISELPVKGSNLDPADLLIVSVVDGSSPTGFSTVKMTGQEILNTISTPSIGLYSQTVQSSTVTNTTTPTSIIGTGVGGLTVLANTFTVGDSYHGKIGGIISAQNGDEITIEIKAGTTVLATTGLIPLSATSNEAWELELDFTIATVGATGTMCTNGNFAYSRTQAPLDGYVFQDVEVIDTTIDNTLDILVTWNQAKTQDEIYSANFVLYKVY